MVEAVTAVKEKRMTQRTVPKIYKALRCTFQNCLKRKTQMSTRPGHAPKFGNKDELKLFDYAPK